MMFFPIGCSHSMWFEPWEEVETKLIPHPSQAGYEVFKETWLVKQCCGCNGKTFQRVREEQSGYKDLKDLTDVDKAYLEEQRLNHVSLFKILRNLLPF